FPKKFCQVRWLANAEVATRAVEVLPHVKKYMESVKKLPITVTCRNLAKACDDSLMTAKLSFFSSAATMFEPFLRKFQTAEPMAVFFYILYILFLISNMSNAHRLQSRNQEINETQLKVHVMQINKTTH